VCLASTVDGWSHTATTVADAGDKPSISKDSNGNIGIAFGNGKDIYFALSEDNGRTFSTAEKVATLDGLVLGMSSGPQLSMGDEYYSIVAPTRQGDLSAWRKTTGADKWDGPFRVNDVPGSAGESLADIAFDSNGKLYATWIDTRRAMEGHRGMEHAVAPGGTAHGEYDAGEEGQGAEAGHDMAATAPVMPSREEIMKEVGEMPAGAAGVSLYPGSDGKMYWVVFDQDGKALKAKDMKGYKAFKAKNEGRPKPNGKIFLSVSTDGGESWSESRMVYVAPEGSVCECCKPSIVTDDDDNVLIMFRNNVQGSRDLYLTQSHDGGSTFEVPRKLGMDTWSINGCPMDGGGLDVASGKVATVWQRKGDVFLSVPGQPEELIGPGRFPSIASIGEGHYVLWNQGRDVMALTPGSSIPVNLGTGSYPKVISLPNGEGALGVWIENGKVVTRGLY